MAIRFEYNNEKVEIVFFYDTVSEEDMLFEGFKIHDEYGRRCTAAKIIRNDNEVSIGVSVCRPPDNFSKSTGRKMALRDALSFISDKEFRKEVWRNYRENCK